MFTVFEINHTIKPAKLSEKDRKTRCCVFRRIHDALVVGTLISKKIHPAYVKMEEYVLYENSIQGEY